MKLPVGYRAKREASIAANAERAFAKHEIREAGVRSWLVAQRHPKGGWDSAFAVEILALRFGAILVHGDVEYVIWSSCRDSSTPRAILGWMGDHDGVDSYVVQKARIGTGDALIQTYDPDALEEDLRDMIADVEREKGDGGDPIALGRETDALNDALDIYRDEARDAVVQALYNAGIDGERLAGMGMVTDARLFFAHAALRRLCALLPIDTARGADGG